jgi:hypothetical protein
MCIPLAQRESEEELERDLGTHHNLVDAADLSEARDKEAAVKR